MATTTSLSFVLALAVFTLFFSPAFSTSRRALEHPKMQKGFRVRLKHVDSGKNLTRFERIQHGVKRGRNRLQRLKAMALVASSSSEIESPVLPGNGEYLMKLSIGTPPETYSAILDTGSDLIWTQCKPCSQCFDQSTPIFDPKKSSSFSKLPCSSQLCDALPQSSCKDSCEYLYTYGDYSSTQGILASETLTFGKASVPNVAFGCGADNEGSGFSQGAGLVGLGRGPLSLMTNDISFTFSYYF
uniref:Peptidase A1 domain-containing protein n=1 Tax=Salix viminalis TaxID=40686 RepID=A0A6N2KE02_SALVM